MAKHRRRRGSSRAGRPRLDGDRYPGGKLKPPGPNARVIAERTALMGSALNLHNAADPLDLALARAWITERQHRAGSAFARIHARAGLGAPAMGPGGLSESPEPSARDMRSIAQLSDVEIVAAWDKAVPAPSRQASESAAAGAMDQWLALCAVMYRDEREEVELVCVRKSWPQWVVWRCAEPQGDLATWLVWAFRAGRWERKRELLAAGLDKAAKLLFVRRPRPAEPAEPWSDVPVSRPLDPVHGPRPEEVTVYVDAATQEPFLEVVKRPRRTQS